MEDRRTNAAKFVRSHTFARTIHWDQEIEPCPQDMSIALISHWPEADRSIRAIQLLDREIRRCARALAIVYTKAEEALIPAILDSSELFSEALRGFPRPVHTEAGNLEIVSAEGPNLTLLVEPTEAVWTVMTRWPAATIAYALSSFGMKFTLNLHRNCRLEQAGIAEGDALLPILRDISRGVWRRGDSGISDTWVADDVEALKFQAVADSHAYGGGRLGGLHVVVWRTMADGKEDLVHGGF